MPAADGYFILAVGNDPTFERFISVAKKVLMGGIAPFVAMPFVPSSFLLIVVRPGAPSSVLVPSSKARSP